MLITSRSHQYFIIFYHFQQLENRAIITIDAQYKAMFDVSRILAIPDNNPDHRQMGISAANHRALVQDRGGVKVDGTKAKASVLNKDFSKSYQKAGFIKGDKKLEDTSPSNRGMAVTYNKKGDLSEGSAAKKIGKAISGQAKGGKVVKGQSPDSRNKRPRRDEVILKAQVRKLGELNKQFGDLLDNNPRKGHGGTPNITDNSKGRQMMRSQEKREERLRSLNKQIKEQEDKISKTEWRMDRNTSQTKRSQKFTKKNPIHKGLVDLALEGKLSQWERNPHTFFVKGLNKVALVTFGGEIAPTSKFPAKTKEDWEAVNKIIADIKKRNYKNPLVEN